jgi:hypothetical protein
MPPRLRLFFSALMGILLFIPALGLYREFAGRSDIWWTPAPLALSLSESQDRVQIYVRGKRLGDLLEARQLSVKSESGDSPLETHDIGLRFNNWDRTRAARVPTLLLYAAICGGAAVLLLIIASGRLAYRGEKDAQFVRRQPGTTP